jgi:hypothetical protein|tara:strand:- start:443 stop:787 length:345 start_codon:yes stop_codon:yes gene_type:complete
VNTFQATVMQTTGWVLVLLDGWAMHTHWVAALGFIFLIYSMWSICMKTPEDEAFEEMEKALGWRKRQIVQRQLTAEENILRNETLEEVAVEFDGMKSFGDTAASFAAYVRGLKR